MQFDSVQIGSDDVPAAARAYEMLLGIPSSEGAHGARRFQLGCGAVEITPGDQGLRAVRFSAAAEDDVVRWPMDAFHGLQVDFTAPPAPPPASAGVPGGVDAIDHVVINSPDIDRAIALWRDRLGLLLALDREFPTRGLRLAFFRSADVTLEFAGPIAAGAERGGRDRFYGVAYRVRDLDACRARLVDAGFDVSELRPGQKSGTTVATVRSGTLGVPTLLICDPSRAA